MRLSVPNVSPPGSDMYGWSNSYTIDSKDASDASLATCLRALQRQLSWELVIPSSADNKDVL